MPNLGFAMGTFAFPVWAAGAAVALFVLIGLLTLVRAGTSLAGALVRVMGVAMCVAAVWLIIDRSEMHERAAERRALDQRAADLTARAIAPGSALACLDAVAGDAVESVCERAVFASPESTAAAVSYVSARLGLLADGVDFARRTGGGYEGALTIQRMALETDRFGIVAHVLSVRDSCTPLLCDSYALLHDAGRVQANLREHVFGHYVERYAADWAARAQKAGTPVAEAGPYTTASAPPPPPATVAVPLSSKYDFPSAASIPPVSIMNPEPGMAPDTKAEAKSEVKSETKPATAPPARRPQQAASRPSAKPVPAPPQQIVPPPAALAPPSH
jgi:hypothetical protein